MTALLTPVLRETLAGVRCTLAWQDPDDPLLWYETESYGASHLQKRGEWVQDRSPLTVEGAGYQGSPEVWLSPSIFCSPRSWWQHVAAHPRLTVVPVFLHRGRLVIGPGFTQHGPVCPTCAALRLAQASPYPRLFKALLAGPITCLAGSSLEAAWAALGQAAVASFAVEQCERLRSGAMLSLSLSDEHDEARWHRVLPPPGDHPHHEIAKDAAHLFGVPALPWSVPHDSHAHPAGDLPLTDAFVGPLLVTGSVPKQPGEPRDIEAFVTIAGHLGTLTRWHPDVSGSGLSFSAEHARGASLGEAVERYSGNYIPRARLIYSSENELGRAGRSYVSLERFCPFTTEQQATATWPFAVSTRDTRLPWIEACVLGAEGETALLPAEAVFLGLSRFTGQQSHIPVPLAGIAAHTSLPAATTAAVLELIERDASMLWWHGGIPAERLVDLPPALQEQLERGVPQTIRQWYLLLAAGMPGFTVVGCLHDREHDVLGLGFATRQNLADALRKASAESWQLRRLSLQLLDRGSDLWRDIDRERLPMPTRPFRADRHYAESFRGDFADMHQLTYNTQYFLDPRTHPAALARLTGEPCSFAEAQAAQQDASGDPVSQCIAHLGRRGERLYRVDLTTPDMRALGLTTVRVTCPGLVGNTPTAFLPLGHQRFAEARRRGAQPYLAPMPHA
jgi:ribosomal protein S12 methylthiotransferase accessory factor